MSQSYFVLLYDLHLQQYKKTIFFPGYCEKINMLFVIIFKPAVFNIAKTSESSLMCLDHLQIIKFAPLNKYLIISHRL